MGINDVTQPDATTPPAADQDRTAGAPQDAPVDLTQAQLDQIIANEKAKVRRSIQNEYGDLDALKTAKDQLEQLKQAELSEVEKLQKQIKDMETQQQQMQQVAETERLKALRLSIGVKAGLSPTLASLLQGSDEGAITTHAQEVLSEITKARAPVLPDNDATAGAGHGSGGLPRLTPDEQASARAAGWSDEQYAKMKLEWESYS